MRLADLIRLKRKEKHLSATQLATMVEVTQSTITRWEQGKIRTIKHNKMVLLAEALGVDITEVLDTLDSSAMVPKERILLEGFGSLSMEEQDEILAMIEYKLKRKGRNESNNK